MGSKIRHYAGKFQIYLIDLNQKLWGMAFSVIFKKYMNLLIYILTAVFIFELIFWFVNYVVAFPPPIKTILNVVLVLAMVIFLIWIMMGLRGATF
jgi:hypothetical protein